jgi:ABC-type multidrug transport system permease subunit
MATAQIPLPAVEERSSGQIGVSRLAATLGVGSALIFVLCWLGTFISFSSPTHAYIGLFTLADTQSLQALAEGTIFSLLFGLLSGGIIAVLYNLFASLDRR